MTDYFGDDFQPPKIWTLDDIYNDLVSATEVGPLLNVRVRRVYLWIRKRRINKCPKPVRSWGNLDVYSGEHWKAWYASFLKRHEKILAHQYIAPYVAPEQDGEPFFTYQDDETPDGF